MANIQRKEKIEKTISQSASSLRELTQDQKKAAISELLGVIEVIVLPGKSYFQPDLSHRTEFGVAHKKYGTASVKLENYFISWRRLLLAGGSVPAAYLNSTLSAMTLLTFLAKGAIYVFDAIDAKVLATIHKYSDLLPLATGDFYDRLSDKFPKEINRDLFMQRVVELSKCGAVSIDDDLLKITEFVYFFDQ